MSPTAQQIEAARAATSSTLLRHLTQRYGGATAARAIWRWAGGDEARVPFQVDPSKLWAALWTQASAPGAAPDRFALAREALHDDPGHPAILDFLRAHADEPALRAADLLPSLLVRLRPLGFPTRWLRPVLRSLPATTWEGAFSALAHATQSWLLQTDLELLAASCRTVASFATAIVDVSARREVMRALEKESPGAEAEHARVLVEIAGLERLAADLKRNAPTSTDPAFEELARGLRQSISRLEARKALTAKTATVSLTSLLLSVEANQDIAPFVRLSAVARGLHAALWGSTPLPPPPPEEDAPGVHFDASQAVG